MAKKKTVPGIEVLELDYSLAELPSSQHRAGLAGLVLMVQWLNPSLTVARYMILKPFISMAYRF